MLSKLPPWPCITVNSLDLITISNVQYVWMPLKTHKVAKKHPHHYAKVYWPYIPLVVFLAVGLWLGQPLVERSQRGVLAYATDVSNGGLLAETNQFRLNQGVKPVVLNPELSRAAQAKANDMATRNYWAHLTPEGKTPWTFIDRNSYLYQKAGENLAYGFASNEDVLKGWMNSPAHRQTLLDTGYQDIGFGVANSQNYQNSGPDTIVVALYGQPGSLPAIAATSDLSTKNPGDSLTTAAAVMSTTSTKISKAQAITSGKAPWITFALGLIGGGALVYVVAKNGFHLHRALRDGKRFVLKHPVLDLSFIALVAVCGLLSQSVGFIR